MTPHSKLLTMVGTIFALTMGRSGNAVAQGGTQARQRYQWYLPWDSLPVEIDTRTGFLLAKHVTPHDSVLSVDTIALNKAFVLQKPLPDTGTGNDEPWDCSSAPESYMFIRGPDGTASNGATVDSIEVKPATDAEVKLCAAKQDVAAYRKAHPYPYTIFLWIRKSPSP